MALHEVICPHCTKAFTIDEAGYANIVKQVRDTEFARELNEQLTTAERMKRTEIELAIAKVAGEAQEAASTKNAEIERLKALLEANEVTRRLAVAEALEDVTRQNERLKSDLAIAEHKNHAAVKELEDRYKLQIKERDDAIERLKDFKARLSTKMLGQTLEDHCETTFNQIRATAFPRAYFEKDNDASGGSKGDYIFREVTDAGDEVISMSLVDGGKGVTSEERDAYLRQSRALRQLENQAESGEEEAPTAEAMAEDSSATVAVLSDERFKELQAKEEFVLTAASSGFGKRTSAYEYRVTGRGGKGVELMSLAKGGHVVAAFPVRESDQVMLVTDGGTLIRCPVDGIRIAGRATRGVRIVNVSEGERVVSAIRIGEEDDAGNGSGNGNGEDHSETNGG